MADITLTQDDSKDAKNVKVLSLGTSADTANNGTPNTTDSLFSYVKKLVVDIGAVLTSIVVLARDLLDKKLIDSADSNNVYMGYAAAGTLTSAASWKIRKITTVGALVTYYDADGNTNYDNIWDNRTSLTYS